MRTSSLIRISGAAHSARQTLAHSHTLKAYAALTRERRLDGCLRAGLAGHRAQVLGSVVRCSVELGHQFAVGSPGGGKFAVAFSQLQLQVDDFLF